MKFGYTIIYVPDVPASIAFYEKAFGFSCKFMHDSTMYAELESGETTLAFAQDGMAELNGVTVRFNRPQDVAAGIEIALVSDDPQAAYDCALAAGAIAVKAPALKPWGQTVAYVRDLNGCLVEICSLVA